MHYLMALLSLLVRMVRPSRGIHAAPFAVRRDVREEARAARVRRYADPLPALPSGPGFGLAAVAPAVPRPRRALDDAPALLIPGFYLAYEERLLAARVDRFRLGFAVLNDLAVNANANEVPAC